MHEKLLAEVEATAHARITSAATPADLETVRVEVLGRKGSLAQISKEMGKLAPEERARAGKLLNSVKQALESALESKTADLAAAALHNRRESQCVDLSLRPPG